MRIDNLYLEGKMFKDVSSDSALSGRTCLANLGVWSCLVRKLVCPVRFRPIKMRRNNQKVIQERLPQL